MKKFLVLIVIGSSLIFASCAHHHHGGSSSQGVELNNGKKWQSDKHTYDSINRMKKTVKSSSGKNLKKNLDAELEKLFNGCTMEGKDHDALHDYLNILMPAISELQKGVTKKRTEKVESVLKDYDSYFKK